jgi:hypothetical protein
VIANLSVKQDTINFDIISLFHRGEGSSPAAVVAREVNETVAAIHVANLRASIT